ncbi:hypothetical protein DFJ74DRAFT_9986, partial [Hyaloraphidium curvatum]
MDSRRSTIHFVLHPFYSGIPSRPCETLPPTGHRDLPVPRLPRPCRSPPLQPHIYPTPARRSRRPAHVPQRPRRRPRGRREPAHAAPRPVKQRAPPRGHLRRRPCHEIERALSPRPGPLPPGDPGEAVRRRHAEGFHRPRAQIQPRPTPLLVHRRQPRQRRPAIVLPARPRLMHRDGGVEPHPPPAARGGGIGVLPAQRRARRQAVQRAPPADLGGKLGERGGEARVARALLLVPGAVRAAPAQSRLAAHAPRRAGRAAVGRVEPGQPHEPGEPARRRRHRRRGRRHGVFALLGWPADPGRRGAIAWAESARRPPVQARTSDGRSACRDPAMHAGRADAGCGDCFGPGTWSWGDAEGCAWMAEGASKKSGRAGAAVGPFAPLAPNSTSASMRTSTPRSNGHPIASIRPKTPRAPHTRPGRVGATEGRNRPAGRRCAAGARDPIRVPPR